MKFVGAWHYIGHQILHVLCDYGVLIYATYNGLQIQILDSFLLSFTDRSIVKINLYIGEICERKERNQENFSDAYQSGQQTSNGDEGVHLCSKLILEIEIDRFSIARKVVLVARVRAKYGYLYRKEYRIRLLGGQQRGVKV